MKQKLNSSIIVVVSVVFLTFLDQITKFLAVTRLNPQKGGSDLVIWEGIFRLRYLENRGSAFGLLQGQKVFLIIVTCIVFFLLCWIFFRIPQEKHFTAMRWLITFVMAGAIGNFADRIRLGYVIDFLYFELIDFPIFNVADIYVTCSVFLFIILFLFFYKEEDLERILPAGRRKEEH